MIYTFLFDIIRRNLLSISITVILLMAHAFIVIPLHRENSTLKAQISAITIERDKIKFDFEKQNTAIKELNDAVILKSKQMEEVISRSSKDAIQATGKAARIYSTVQQGTDCSAALTILNSTK